MASNPHREASRIGLISDTHGLLREAALSALSGSELIIHAGDVGNPGILERLKAIAPVVTVRGNIDKGEWARELPATAVVETELAVIYVLHDLKELDLMPEAAGIQIVVSGHSHKHSQAWRAGVLYVNPGSAGPVRFKLPVTVARLDLKRSPWEAEFVSIL